MKNSKKNLKHYRSTWNHRSKRRIQLMIEQENDEKEIQQEIGSQATNVNNLTFQKKSQRKNVPSNPFCYSLLLRLKAGLQLGNVN